MKKDTFTACCPAHDDQSASLSVRKMEDGNIAVKCFTGCTTDQICDAIGIRSTELFSDYNDGTQEDQTTSSRKVVESYDYHDLLGHVRFTVDRVEPGKCGRKKDFFPRHVNSRGVTVWGLADVERCLYNWPAVAKSDDVWVVEGERKAKWLNECGFVATSCCGGAASWMEAYTTELKDKHIVLCPDNDEAGAKFAKTVMDTLSNKCKTLTLVKVDGNHNDIVDAFREIGDDQHKRRQYATKLLSSGIVYDRGIDVPIYSLSAMEDEYAKFIANAGEYSMYPGRWLTELHDSIPDVRPGELLVFLAGTGVGKTLILQNLALHCSPLTVLLFELELPNTLTFERFAAMATSQHTDIIVSSYRDGNRVDWRGNDQTKRIFVCEKTGLTLDAIRELYNKSELLIGHKPHVVMLDYIQLMQGRNSDRYEKTSDLAEGLKRLAKELKAIVVVASQCSRTVKPGDEVTLCDGKDSGAIENSAGIVVGAWRSQEPTKKNEMILRVLKNTRRGEQAYSFTAKIASGLRIVDEHDVEPSGVSGEPE